MNYDEIIDIKNIIKNNLKLFRIKGRYSNEKYNEHKDYIKHIIIRNLFEKLEEEIKPLIKIKETNTEEYTDIELQLNICLNPEKILNEIDDYVVSKKNIELT